MGACWRQAQQARGHVEEAVAYLERSIAVLRRATLAAREYGKCLSLSVSFPQSFPSPSARHSSSSLRLFPVLCFQEHRASILDVIYGPPLAFTRFRAQDRLSRCSRPPASLGTAARYPHQVRIDLSHAPHSCFAFTAPRFPVKSATRATTLHACVPSQPLPPPAICTLVCSADAPRSLARLKTTHVTPWPSLVCTSPTSFLVSRSPLSRNNQANTKNVMDFSPIILSNPPAFLRTFALTNPAASIDTGALPLPLYRHGEGTIYLEGEGEESAFLLEAFVLSRSKVLKLSSVRSSDALTACLARVTAAMEDHQDAEGQPLAFTIRDDWAGPHVLAHDECWVVFPTHEQARSALSLSLSNGVLVNLKAALETDLEPQTKLQLLDGGYRTVSASPTESPTDSITRTTGSAITNPHNVGMGLLLNSNFQQIQVKYNLSSNPPNPKVTFRTGDWLCSIPSCNAHNFGRNMACYGCGNPRHIQTANTMNTNNIGYGLLNTNNSHSHPSTQQPHSSHPATIHHALGAAASRTASPSRTQAPHGGPIVGLQVPSKPPAPSYPLLTPSGHALASGGRVMNISRDGVALCFMYWPDNEPLPERGQIRPLGSAVIQYPPIINTGNKGAAEKQPGDWVCSKCNYLNWRRRKVCQTCYPYAEGNGDSISQAVQAERIALLTNVLNQVDATTQLPLNLQRRSSVPVNAVAPAPAVYGGAQPPFVHPPNPASRPRSQMDLRTQYHPISPVPGPCANGFAYPQQPQHQYAAIYQTPSYPSSPRTNTSPARSRVPSPTANALASPPLLPSFLQDIIQSDSAQSSPATSTSSWSFDELEYGGHPSAYRYTKFDPLREGAHASVVGPHQVGVIGQPRRSAGATESSQAKASAMYQSPSASTSSDLGLSIWRMDDTESRTFGLGNSGRAAPVYNGKERSVEAVVDLAARFGNKLSLISA